MFKMKKKTSCQTDNIKQREYEITKYEEQYKIYHDQASQRG